MRADGDLAPIDLDDRLSSSANGSASSLAVAFMVSPDGSGESVITIGREDRGRVGWLIAHVAAGQGITRAIEDTTTVDEAQTRLLRFRKMTPRPGISAEIPFDYALARLAEAVDRSENLPPVMEYWREILPKSQDLPHPAEELPRASPSPEELRSILLDFEPTSDWRLPALEEIFSPSNVRDHRIRLLDLAYLMNLKGDAKAPIALAAADDLEARGISSVYAIWMAAKTAVRMIETIQSENARERLHRDGGKSP